MMDEENDDMAGDDTTEVQGDDGSLEAPSCKLEERGDGGESLADQLTALQLICDDRQQELLRALAEMDNLRKRTSREMDQARKFAVEGFAKDLLAVADNLERALGAIGNDELAGPVQALSDGVRMIQGELNNVFARHGITPIAAMDTPFDPNLHQAVVQVENGEVNPGTVVMEMQKGYLLNGRLLRASMVGVAKAPA